MPLLFGAAVLMLVATAAFAAASLRVASPVAFALAAYVVASSEIVALTEVLSPGRLVGWAGYTIGELVLLATALAVWRLRGRPRPVLPRLDRAALRRHPLLAGLGAAVFLAGVYQLFLVVATPPNNDDSMSQHLSRAAAWLQHGGFYWIPQAHTARENEWAPNGEFEVLYTFAFLHRDTLAGAVQLVAEGALLLAVAGGARRLGYSCSASVFAGLVTATLSQVALQSVTTQVDLLVASFVAVAAYFLAAGTGAELVVAGLALGLAIGTKATALLAVPPLALLTAVSLPRRLFPRAVACAAGGILAVGAFGYVENQRQTGNPLGSGTAARGYRPHVTPRGTVSSFAKLTYRFVDFPGYHLPPGVRRPIADAGDSAFDAFHIPVNTREATGYPFVFDVNISSHESIAWYGPLGFLLVVPLSLLFVGLALARRATVRIGAHAVALPIYALLLTLVYRDGPWYGRYLLAGVVFALPLVAATYRVRALATVVAVVGVLTLALTHGFNAMKPTGIDGRTPVWRLSREQAQSLEIPGYDRVAATVEATVPEGDRLGLVFAEHDWDYPFYGEKLDRKLVNLRRGDPIAEAERRGLDWVLLGRSIAPPPLEPGWSARRMSWYGTLLVRDGADRAS